jgi:cation transport ATPase
LSCAHVELDAAEHRAPRLWTSRRFWWSVASWSFIGCAALTEGGGIRIACLASAILVGAHEFAREAVERLLRRKEVGIDLLMTVSVVGAAAIGLRVAWRL